jgi:arylsulfatase
MIHVQLGSNINTPMHRTDNPFRIMKLVALTLCLLAPICEAADRPNIIVILADDMGFSDIGCYGSEIPTPHLDSLAANGVKFKQFYNNARCCPTRASLLTGLYSHQAGIGHMAGADQKLPGYLGHLNEQCVTIAQWLQPAGYFTAMCGKWHVGNEAGSNPWERGFQRSINATAGGFYLPDSPKAKLFEDGRPIASRGGSLPQDWYSSDLWSLLGLRFVSEAKTSGKPFFLYLPFNAPHFPLQARAEDIAKFRGRYKRGWDALRDERHARQIELGLIDASWNKSSRPAAIKLWREHTPEEQDRFDHLMAVYAATVHCMDRAIGGLIAGLKREGAFDNTLILFMSDNGGNAESGPAGRTNGDPTLADSNWFCGESWAFLQNTPFRRYKHYTHEGGISTPLIAHWPQGITKRGWINEPAHLIDIASTIQDLTGAAYPKEDAGKPITPLEGNSLKPILVSESASLSISRSLFWEHEGNAAVRRGDLKLVRKGSDGPWELYDLKADRTETNDIASSQPTKVKELAAEWQKWAERAHVLPQPGMKKEESEAPKKVKGKGMGKAHSLARKQPVTELTSTADAVSTNKVRRYLKCRGVSGDHRRRSVLLWMRGNSKASSREPSPRTNRRTFH